MNKRCGGGTGTYNIHGDAVTRDFPRDALRKGNHDEAINFFERARKKNPRDPQVLNNLAYAYLQAEDRNPEQALLLVDQAITYLINSPNIQQNRQAVVSSFFDTRGVALMPVSYTHLTLPTKA